MSISEVATPSEEENKWYAMNAFRGGAVSIQNKLRASNIECFVPMEYRLANVKGGKARQMLLAVIPSLIFVKSTFSTLDSICSSTGNMHFRYTKVHGGNKNVPIVIATEEMDRFIDFVDGNEEHVSYIQDPDAFDIAQGERVVITEGPFAGREAIFVKVKSEARRQIVLELEHILGVKVKCTFPSRIVEKIKI